MEETKKVSVPSLGALAFIESHKHYLSSQEDVLAVGAHLFSISTSETLLELKDLLDKQQKNLVHLAWMEKLLAKVNGDERLEKLVRDSKFKPFPEQTFMIANYEGYCIDVSNSRVVVSEISSFDEFWTFDGEPDEYTISRTDGDERGALMTPAMINYIVFLWRDLIETCPDGVNYNGLVDISSDEEAERWEFLEGLIREVS